MRSRMAGWPSSLFTTMLVCGLDFSRAIRRTDTDMLFASSTERIQYHKRKLKLDFAEEQPNEPAAGVEDSAQQGTSRRRRRADLASPGSGRSVGSIADQTPQAQTSQASAQPWQTDDSYTEDNSWDGSSNDSSQDWDGSWSQDDNSWSNDGGDEASAQTEPGPTASEEVAGEGAPAEGTAESTSAGQNDSTGSATSSPNWEGFKNGGSTGTGKSLTNAEKWEKFKKGSSRRLKIFSERVGKALKVGWKASRKAAKQAGEHINELQVTKDFKAKLAHGQEVTKAVLEHTTEQIGLADPEEKKKKERQRQADVAQRKKDMVKWRAERVAKRKQEKEAKVKNCKPCGKAKINDRLRLLLCRAEVLDYKLPSPTNRVKNACKSPSLQKTMLKHATSVRPIIHPRAKKLAEQFLAYKKKQGSSVEKEVYENMTIGGFLQRLMVKRPVVFFGPMDSYMTREGKTGYGGFETIGTDKEKWPLYVADYLSYEEMEISALMGVSVPTSFINNGNRHNNCKKAPKGSFEAEGIYIAQVGTRFEMVGKMEWRHMIASKEQNSEENGYGKAGAANNPMLAYWAEFYGFTYLPTHKNALQHRKKYGGGRFLPGNGKKGFQKNAFFDSAMYKARCDMTAEMFLAEANERAKANGAKAYCQIAGLGLGAWRMHRSQGGIQKQSYLAVIKRMSLPHIGAIVGLGGGKGGSMFVFDKDGSRIQLVSGKRSPATKLPASKPGSKPWLLVAQYAWDGNSYPGNEYWLGKSHFKMSGDPAAACSSYIPELQNPEVNVEAFEPTNVRIVPPKALARKQKMR